MSKTNPLDPAAVLETLLSLLPSETSSAGQLQSPHDGLAALFHAVLSRLDFRVVGLGEEDRLSDYPSTASATPQAEASSSSCVIPILSPSCSLLLIARSSVDSHVSHWGGRRARGLQGAFRGLLAAGRAEAHGGLEAVVDPPLEAYPPPRPHTHQQPEQKKRTQQKAAYR